ncbi:MAG: hypothetical protein B7Z66_04650 [Chromatiales bacterium 21-64-14]|nr:MAG: hypothetical protein B7Z66_04650 [Chromatiales bacterium 21-64-14]HQU14619.1 TonB family protein [Gammaproteobacteria bacterium]
MSRALPRFLVLSAALHLALLAAWRVPPRLSFGAPSAGAPLQLRFGVAAAPMSGAGTVWSHATSRPVSVPARRVAHRASPRTPPHHEPPQTARRRPWHPVAAAVSPHAVARDPVGGDTARVVVHTVMSGAQPGAHAERTPSSAAGNGASVAQFLRSAVLRLLADHFEYPWIARRQGWEGEVRLALRVGSDGRVSDLRVVGTSGYAILDRSALESARHIHSVPDAARWLDGRHFDIVLPVEYRLVNG